MSLKVSLELEDERCLASWEEHKQAHSKNQELQEDTSDCSLDGGEKRG